MSSHHIVREKQEPALLVLGLDNFPDELLGQLLEWSPTVITIPDTAEQLNSLGIKVDWLITNDNGESLQSDVKLMEAGADDPAVAALQWLINNHYPAVNVITDIPQWDNMLAYAPKIDLVIFQGGRKNYTVHSGFSKWKPAGEIIKIWGNVTDFEYNGIEQTGHNTFKTTRDGFFTLHFQQPFLLLAEPLG